MTRKKYTYKEFLQDSKKIVNYFKDQKIDCIVGLSRGGLALAQMVAYGLDIRDVFCVRVEGYDDTNMRDEVVVLDTPDLSKFKNILVVDDIIDSGKSMQKVVTTLDIDPQISTLFYKDNDIIQPDFFCHYATCWIDFFWEER